MIKKVICILAGSMSISTFSLEKQNILNLSSSNCDIDKCEILIKDDGGNDKGNLFISKKTNKENGASEYNILIKNNGNDTKYLISCISNYTCKAFTYNESSKADLAFASNKFKQDEKSESTVLKENIKITSDRVSIYSGNNPIILGITE